MKRITVTKLTCPLFLLLLLVACTEAEVIGGNHSGQQTGEVETTFNLEVTPSQSPVTRSITFTAQGSTTVDTLAVGETSLTADTLQTRSATDLPDAQEKKVAGLWIGQYDATGTTLLSHQYIESVTGTQVTAKLVAANNCKVRFVANAGNLGSINTEALLNAKTLPYASTTDGRPQSNLFAMTGAWTGNITGTTNVTPPTIPTVTLTRLAAKITFTYKINGTGFSFTPTSVSLKQVPNLSLIGTPDQINPVRPADATYTTSYTGTISNKGATMYWYLPENMAGTATGSNAVNSEKEKTGQGVTNATYIELFGNAVQNGVEYKNVAFHFYPGKDANDYNIKRNDHYIMSIDLKGLDISDKRITVGDIPPITVNPAGNFPVLPGDSKDVQITSRAGVVWSLPLPQWLSATIDGQTTPPGSTLTNQGPCLVTFTTTEINPDSTARSNTFTVGMGDGTNQSFTLTQDNSLFTVAPTTLNVGFEGGVTDPVTVNGTPGLVWTVSPTTTTNGITPTPTNGTANGGNQSLSFQVAKNTGAKRSAEFTISVPAGNHTKKVVVTQEADPALVIIDQALLRRYGGENLLYPPFDMEGTNQILNKYGITYIPNGTSSTMSGSYAIQVQDKQEPDTKKYETAKTYCASLIKDGTGWRLPTQIELFAMWEKAIKNTSVFGDSFISNFYWSSSVYGADSSEHCVISFYSGGFNSNITAVSYSVRCVRDLN